MHYKTLILFNLQHAGEVAIFTMDYYILEYPLFSCNDERYNSLNGPLQPPSLNGVGDQCQPVTLPNQRGSINGTETNTPDSSSRSSSGEIEVHRSSNSESPSSKQTVIAHSNEKTCNSDAKSFPELDQLDALKRRVSWLESQLVRQQQCYKKREDRLKQLYEEELDIAEEEHQKTMLEMIKKCQSRKCVTLTPVNTLGERSLKSTAARKKNKSVSTDLSLGETWNLTNAAECVTVGCNTESYPMMNEEGITLNYIESHSEAEILHKQTQSIYSRLDKLIGRFTDCSHVISTLDNGCDQANNKTPSRRRRRRKQPVQPQSDQLNRQGDHSPAQIVPDRKSAVYSSMKNSPCNVSTGQESPNQPSQLDISPPEKGDGATEAEIGVSNDGDAGWELVTSKRQRRFRTTYQNEACVIAAAINNVPLVHLLKKRANQLPNSSSKSPLLSCTNNPQLGKVTSSHSPSRTINSEIPTLASRSYASTAKKAARGRITQGMCMKRK